MTRLEKREAILPKYGRDTIPTLCIDMRMACNGSADPCTDKEKARGIAFLRCCLETWQLPEDRGIDAVRELIEATLAEISGDAPASAWTTTPPTEDGRYWHRDGDGLCIVEVEDGECMENGLGVDEFPGEWQPVAPPRP